MESLEQSRIVVDATYSSALIINFDSDIQSNLLYIIVHIKINLLNFYSFENELQNIKKKLKGSLWEISKEEEEILTKNYKKITDSKNLNVELLINSESLKDDYKKMSVI